MSAVRNIGVRALVVAALALAACGETDSRETTSATTSSTTSSTHGATSGASTGHSASSTAGVSAASTTGASSTTGTTSTTGTSSTIAASTTGTTSTSAGATGTSTSAGATGTSTSTSTGGTTGNCCDACTAAGESCDAASCQCGASLCQTGAAGAVPADALDLSTVTLVNSPDITTWPATTSLTTVDLEAQGAHLEFDKENGPSRWPDYSGPAGTVEYTLWLFENINGTWYGSAGIRYSNSDYWNGGAPSGYGVNWFYDANRWGVMANRQPAVGELVGFMVSAGDARDNDGTNVQERSNLVLVPFPADTGADFSCQPGSGTGATTGTTGVSTTGGTTSGSTTGGGTTTGSSGPDCCSGACSPSGQYCDPVSCQCQAQGSFDLSQATVYDSPPDIANWPVTTQLTRLDIESSGFHVEFSKQDGPDRWPDVYIPGWNGGNLQYTLWSVEYINGAWQTSGPVEYWYGLYESGGAPSGFAADWYYDTYRWGPLANYQPAVGEWVGFFVTAGNARNITSDDPAQSTVMERSNVVVVPFPADTGQNVNFQ